MSVTRFFIQLYFTPRYAIDFCIAAPGDRNQSHWKYFPLLSMYMSELQSLKVTENTLSLDNVNSSELQFI